MKKVFNTCLGGDDFLFFQIIVAYDCRIGSFSIAEKKWEKSLKTPGPFPWVSLTFFASFSFEPFGWTIPRHPEKMSLDPPNISETWMLPKKLPFTPKRKPGKSMNDFGFLGSVSPTLKFSGHFVKNTVTKPPFRSHFSGEFLYPMTKFTHVSCVQTSVYTAFFQPCQRKTTYLSWLPDNPDTTKKLKKKVLWIWAS